MGLTEQERGEVLRHASGGAVFMFIPSEQLSNMVLKGHPETDEINDSLRLFLIQRDAIRIDSNLIIKYCKNTLDRKNTWLLDRGDIKVISNEIEKIKGE